MFRSYPGRLAGLHLKPSATRWPVPPAYPGKGPGRSLRGPGRARGTHSALTQNEPPPTALAAKRCPGA
jgi:hypothetical protein